MLFIFTGTNTPFPSFPSPYLKGELMADGEPPPMGMLGHAFGALLSADFFSSQYGRLEVGVPRQFQSVSIKWRQ